MVLVTLRQIKENELITTSYNMKKTGTPTP
jgi:hypothetical protein